MGHILPFCNIHIVYLLIYTYLQRRHCVIVYRRSYFINVSNFFFLSRFCLFYKTILLRYIYPTHRLKNSRYTIIIQYILYNVRNEDNIFYNIIKPSDFWWMAICVDSLYNSRTFGTTWVPVLGLTLFSGI